MDSIRATETAHADTVEETNPAVEATVGSGKQGGGGKFVFLF